MIASQIKTYTISSPSISTTSYGEQYISNTTTSTVQGTLNKVSKIELLQNPQYQNNTYTFICFTRNQNIKENDLISDETGRQWRVDEVNGKYCLLGDM